MNGTTKEGKGSIFVVIDGIARKKTVTFTRDDGIRIEVIEGLRGDESVIVGNNIAIVDGQSVSINGAAVSASSDRK